MSEMKAFPLVDVHVLRGSDVITTSVPKHEVEVLRAVHGLEKVQIIGPSEDTRELSTSADEEYARLQRTYQRVNSPDLVAVAFRQQGPAFLRDFGFETGRGRSEPAPQSGVRKHKPAKAAEQVKAPK